MIQELLGGVLDDRKMPMAIPGGLLLDPSTTLSPMSSASSQSTQPSASSSLTSSPAGEQQQQNLRCPRCDSSNTKFCYYNNYNLTQPRHFCKTCRRYWTKGGALRNVPIGGGCRKTKVVPSIASSGVVGKCGVSKATKPASTTDLLSKSGLFGGFDRDFVSSPVLWPSPHSTSHLMALLRSASVQNTNSNACSSFNLNCAKIKEDGSMFGEHMVPEPASAMGNANDLGLDPLVQLPLGASLWRNHSSNYANHQHSTPQAQPLQQQQQQQHVNMLTRNDVITSSGIQDLQHQRLKCSSNYHNDHLQTIASNVGGVNDSCCPSFVTAAATSIMEPNPLSAADLCYWNTNQALAWTDLPTANAPFP